MDPKCLLTSTDLQTRRARCQHQLSFLLSLGRKLCFHLCICVSVGLSVYMSVCLSVRLLTGLLKNWSNLYKIIRNSRRQSRDQYISLWVTLTQREGHRISKSKSFVVKIIIQSRDKLQRSLFDSVNISKHDHGCSDRWKSKAGGVWSDHNEITKLITREKCNCRTWMCTKWPALTEVCALRMFLVHKLSQKRHTVRPSKRK